MLLRLILALLIVTPLLRGATAPEAILVVVGDQHSAYDKLPQFVARVDRLRAENPGVPLAVLIDGDAFEYGNVVGRRTEGALDLAVFAALAQRVPTVLNLGNHEPDLFDMPGVVARLQAAGVIVVSGNARSHNTGQPFAPASTRLKLGAHELTLVGVTTDRLATFRVAIRPELDLADPVVWAKQNFPSLLKDAALPIVMSHAGVKADRQLFALVPPQTLLIGAHDHLRFVHREGALLYFHSGSWMDTVSIVALRHTPVGLTWDIVQEPLAADAPADPVLAQKVGETLAKTLTPEETAVVGKAPRALSPSEAATFAVDAARRAAGADVAVIGGTTFGAGVPVGNVSRYAFDAWIRFDGTLWTGEIDGAALKQLLAHANQGSDTPFVERQGENLVAVGPVPTEIVPGKRYRLVTSDWIAKTPAKYLGENPPTLMEQPKLRLKQAALDALR